MKASGLTTNHALSAFTVASTCAWMTFRVRLASQTPKTPAPTKTRPPAHAILSNQSFPSPRGGNSVTLTGFGLSVVVGLLLDGSFMSGLTGTLMAGRASGGAFLLSARLSELPLL